LVRFRHKLSIVLVMLVLVPLLAAGLLVGGLLANNERAAVDDDLSASLAGASAVYRSRLDSAGALAASIASRSDVQQGLRDGDVGKLHLNEIGEDKIEVLQPGQEPAPASGPVWRTEAQVGKGSKAIGRVVVTIPLDAKLLHDIADSTPRAKGVGLALIVNGAAVATTGEDTGEVSGLEFGHATDATVAGQGVRAQSLRVSPQGTSPEVALACTYPLDKLQERINSLQLKVLLAVLVLGALLSALALLAADRITRALSDLSTRATSIVRSTGEEPPAAGDELEELDAALDVMSTELSTRMTELESERARLKETLARYGETLAATHDLRALVGAVLETAVRATRARGGRLLLYDGVRGEATEQARIGTARGSRTDLPMVVSAGTGLEGEAIQSLEPRESRGTRPMLAVPILREHQPLGVVTVVDPEGGQFAADDVETLSGLAVQAGVAIENARLHRQVEQQAITDELSGLANRRQFFEVLEREFERAQRFGQELALILLDIDDFKQVNDSPQLGHLAGDSVIRSIARTVEGLIREIDLAARYGGEEFAVLLPQTSLTGAVNLAERLRTAIAERPVAFGERSITGVTASFGVAAGPGAGTSPLDLIASADDALYQSKREGKNRVSAPSGGAGAVPPAGGSSA
jgi:diguanylate cyclase (GGDEF)-like protein